MGAEQIYNPMTGINRMISDIENAITPILFRMQPILRITGAINIYLVAAVFLLLVLYMKLRRKHSIIKKLKQPSNYIIVGAMLIAYVFLSVHKIELGPYISLDIGENIIVVQTADGRASVSAVIKRKSTDIKDRLEKGVYMPGARI